MPSFIIEHKFKSFLLCLLGLLAAFCALCFSAYLLWGPGGLPPHSYGRQSDFLLISADGRPLAWKPHQMRRAGPWIDQEDMPLVLIKAALAAEDQRFYEHPGVDLRAVLRAAWQNWQAGRVVSGGSTLSMQLARLLNPAPRNYKSKLKEMCRALWLERRLSKEEILNAWLNLAPFGGPLVGVGAGSQALFGKSVHRLAPHEAALLLALPKDPGRLLQPQNQNRLLARRNSILMRMAQAGALSAFELERSLARPLQLAPAPKPSVPAQHFAEAILRRLPEQAPSIIQTDLDPVLQDSITSLVAQATGQTALQGLRQAAVVVLRNCDRAVLAWVGSPDFRNVEHGQVDGVLALRQPGSTLKPFVYALALEQGYHLAQTIDDSPFSLALSDGTYRPVDYDGKHRGLVSLRTALGSSLNLPALRLCRHLTPALILERLHDSGFSLPKSAAHYGLGLALGNGEVSLLELAQAYAALADAGRFQPARLWRGQQTTSVRQVFYPPAAALITSVLADDQARGMGFGRHTVLELPFAAAVKTGTSQQHRDNWCIGYTSQYTVGVWAGNFEGQPMSGLSGISGAAPIWRQVMLALHKAQPGFLPPLPPGLISLEVCTDSNEQAGPACREKRSELFMSELTPQQLCPVHSVEQQALSSAPEMALNFITPAPDAVYALDPDLDLSLQILHCRLEVRGVIEQASWELDGQALPSGLDPLQMRLPLAPGWHNLKVTAAGPAGQRTARVRFLVK